MEIFGHSQISFTLDTYPHGLPILEREAADKMDAVLGSTVKAVGSLLQTKKGRSS